MKNTTRTVTALLLAASGYATGCIGDPATSIDAGTPAVEAGTDASGPDTSVPTPDASQPDAPPTFNPKQVAGLAMWLDPGAGITDVAGNVSAWADVSGAGLTVTQATPANQPTKGTVNSKPVLVFSATSWLEATGAALGAKLDFGTSDLTVEYVCAVDAPSQAFTGLLVKSPDVKTAPYDGLQAYGNLGGGGKPGAGLDGQGLMLTANSGNTADGKLHLLGFRRVGAKLSLRLDGAELLASTVVVRNVDNVGPLWVGGRADFVHSAPNKTGDILIYKGSVSDTDVARVETFLKAKNGI